jgi:alkanesulfonate monooxygenase SsuD/methylene tetrahydromethanopterin reductase-like flavin-dependent oxidoreductase (luciferase family)
MDPQRQPQGTAFALRDPWSWRDFAELAREGEALGYRAVFLPEIAGRDDFAALSALAGETDALLLGTGIVPMGSRTPLLTAMGAATVDERSGGRLILGLGTGPAVSGALDRLRALVVALRGVFAGERVHLEGEPMRLTLRLPSPPPIWISALGPRAVRLAGEVADGVLLNWCTPDRVAEAAKLVREGAESAGRDPAAIAVAVYVRANLGEDPVAAMAALKDAVGEYASFPAYARQFALMGLGAQAEAAAAARGARRPDEIPESLVHAVALTGDPADARRRLQAYADAGARLPVVYPAVAAGDPVGSAARTLRELAPGA